MNWNFDMHEAPMHRSEPVLIAAKDSNRQFVAWYNHQVGRWVGLPPAFEPLAWKPLDPHPRPGKTPPVEEQMKPKPTVALPPGVVIPGVPASPAVALPPGVV